MPTAIQIPGRIYAGHSATLLARITRAGAAITAADIAAATYSIWLLDARNEAIEGAPLEGHADAIVSPSDLLSTALVDDAEWTVDKLGRNFRHVVDVLEHPAFALERRSYRVQFELIPNVGQIIPVRFVVTTI